MHEETALPQNPLPAAGGFFSRFRIFFCRIHTDLTRGKYPIVTIILLTLWASIVVFTSARHEFWRDEVHPLSIAREAQSLWDIYKVTEYDGHPFLWYLILFVGKSIVNAPIILPIISITVAFGAVALFMFLSPFPFFLRCLFIFGALPLYEYSVMARDYGISMLLLFSAAAIHSRKKKHPLLLAGILFLLANTNVISAILVCFIGIAAFCEFMRDRKLGSRTDGVLSQVFFFVIVVSGVLLCAAYTWPKPQTIVTSVDTPLAINKFATAFLKALYAPGHSFSSLAAPVHSEIFVTILLYLTLLGLSGRFYLFFAGVGAQVALGVFFRIVYKGAFRHQGLYFIFLMFLFWMLYDSFRATPLTKNKRIFFMLGLFGGLFPFLALHCFNARFPIMADITMERSSSKAFGHFLTLSNAYRDAIIVPEPDYLLESLPYYANNPIYLPREHRFGGYVNFWSFADSQLTLAALISTAQELKNRYAKPVLIAFGHWNINFIYDGRKKYSYNKVLVWNQKEVKDFREHTRLVKMFNTALSDENYQVYELK